MAKNRLVLVAAKPKAPSDRSIPNDAAGSHYPFSRHDTGAREGGRAVRSTRRQAATNSAPDGAEAPLNTQRRRLLMP
jgi:hypothetical protein